MRDTKIIPNQYYHVYNRGNNKQCIFFDDKDWARFLFLILYFQSPVIFNNIGYTISKFIKHRVFDISPKTLEKILNNRTVELTTFTLMPNHFHLILRQNSGNGISSYMQRIQNSYTKYANAKYGKTGHLFQGPFKIKRIEDNKQLLHLSAYIHRNPREIDGWENQESSFFWSSFQDYIEKNRWGELLKNDIINEQFTNPEEYKIFVNTSGTKLDIEEKD